jgi:histidinol dehydrogenase
VIGVSPSGAALEAVERALEQLGGEQLPPATARLLAAADIEAALVFAEAFAPEHLELIGSEAEELAPRVRAAGCLFVGASGGTAFGDYVAGSNHVLPTGGAARFASALSPRHFRRRMAEVRLPASGQGLAELARAGSAIAAAEGFPLHAVSMDARVRENDHP